MVNCYLLYKHESCVCEWINKLLISLQITMLTKTFLSLASLNADIRSRTIILKCIYILNQETWNDKLRHVKMTEFRFSKLLMYFIQYVRKNKSSIFISTIKLLIIFLILLYLNAKCSFLYYSELPQSTKFKFVYEKEGNHIS